MGNRNVSEADFHALPREHGGGHGAWNADAPTDLGLGERADAYGLRGGPHYGKGPKGYTRSDERIREEVCEAILQQGRIDASDVEVFVETGVVRFEGTVDRRFDKVGLEHLADRVHGVVDVQNHIRLRRDLPRDVGAGG